jgi:hypothetical protein
MTKAEAESQAQILLENLKTGPYAKGDWQVKVWETIWWHAAVSSPYMRIHWNEFQKKYSCLVNTEGNRHSEDCFPQAGETPYELDPNQAIERRLHQIENWIKGLSTTLDDIKLSVGVE